MRFWVVTALRYIKSEEITPVELMTANELGSQLTPSAMRRRWHILPGGPVKAGKSHSHLLARAMGAVNTGHLADDDPDDST